LGKGNSLIVLSHEKLLPIATYLVKASRQIGIDEVVLVQLPEILRPIVNVPEILVSAITKANAVISVVQRWPEETDAIWGGLTDICKKNKCKHVVLYDPDPSYFKNGGILADYKEVDRKSKMVRQVLNSSKRVEVSSDTGTSVSFQVSATRLCSPIYSPDALSSPSARDILIQAPEGEVQGTPLEDTFNGKVAMDGAITGTGIPDTPITWTFEKGRVTSVDGPRVFLSALLEYVRRMNRNVGDLLGHSIAEFAVGTNDWAFFDENISNSEKVSGSVHFGIGHARGKEMFHMDGMLTKPSVTVTDKNDREIHLIEKGSIRV